MQQARLFQQRCRTVPAVSRSMHRLFRALAFQYAVSMLLLIYF